jgi:hypothetical protein
MPFSNTDKGDLIQPAYWRPIQHIKCTKVSTTVVFPRGFHRIPRLLAYRVIEDMQPGGACSPISIATGVIPGQILARLGSPLWERYRFLELLACHHQRYLCLNFALEVIELSIVRILWWLRLSFDLDNYSIPLEGVGVGFTISILIRLLYLSDLHKTT